MNDVVIEQLVTKRPDTKTVLTKLLIIAAGILVTSLPLIIDILFMPTEAQGSLLSLTPLTLAGAIFGMVVLFRRFNIEYEYILTNGELDVDKIMGQRSRKRILDSANCRAFDVLAPLTPEYQREYIKEQLKIMDLSSSPDAPDRWFAIFNREKGGRTVLIFEPGERLLEGLKKFVPRSKIMK